MHAASHEHRRARRSTSTRTRSRRTRRRCDRAWIEAVPCSGGTRSEHRRRPRREPRRLRGRVRSRCSPATPRDDAFNALVLGAGSSWREVALLRAYSRYLRQVGTLFSQTYIATRAQRAIPTSRARARRVLPRPLRSRQSHAADARRRPRAARATSSSAALDAVTSLDDDRILRALLTLVLATLRTNWFQRDATASRRRASCSSSTPPHPRPAAARARCSRSSCTRRASKACTCAWARSRAAASAGRDRREDFRTEVLGLMKAQTVKNAVIVPAGAKGGFVVEAAAAGTDREPGSPRARVLPPVHRRAARRHRQPRQPAGSSRRAASRQPDRVVRYDGDDPYLVVAADKGTATFSDIANEIALARGFWLGDAFASGGSSGYDHKEMGITARGAWESVRAHFRHLGIDPDRDDFTVVGIGDMSGDVFGNGMLLVAAHPPRRRVRPPPRVPRPRSRPAASFEERARLFALPRSSWADYDAALHLRRRRRVRAHGEVRSRSRAEVRAALGIADDVAALSPPALIARDPARAGRPALERRHRHLREGVDRDERRRRRQGQRRRADRRVAAALPRGGRGRQPRPHPARPASSSRWRGGRINTDAIDNSAGVDTSDHEVNIKILLDDVVARGELHASERDALLAGDDRRGRRARARRQLPAEPGPRARPRRERG